MSITLKKYQAKRKFKETPEPKGKVLKLRRRRFVIQKHQATRLHYDLRLEIGGVLKSWAVTKQPPLRAGLKRLAVPTENHPASYLTFKGIIPKGHYGAGKVEIWDKGTYEIISKDLKAKKGKSLKFILKGKKLKGEYVLYQFREKAWLFYKVKAKN